MSTQVAPDGVTVNNLQPGLHETDRVASLGPTQAQAASERFRQIKDAYEALTGADVMTIVTEWNEFRMLDLERAKDLMAEPCMVDMRNIYHPDRIAAEGFRYFGVGR